MPWDLVCVTGKGNVRLTGVSVWWPQACGGELGANLTHMDYWSVLISFHVHSRELWVMTERTWLWV